jgi:2-keto-4-pentenoate hydratase/2-oxohepta-3-ene-1,7-dioic acid hydratase in catechol pathway
LVKEFNNVYCVGRNYASFAGEMGNALPEKPIIFMKPNHSLIRMNNSSVELSAHLGEVNGEAEIVLHIGKAYQEGMPVDELVDKYTIGIDFTYRAVLNEVKKKGQPWLPAKGFPDSSAIGEFRSFSSETIQQNNFNLIQNDETLQVGHVKNMIFSLQTVIDFIAEHYGLGEGDLIYTGTPEGIAKLKHNDDLTVQWGSETLGTSKIVLK